MLTMTTTSSVNHRFILRSSFGFWFIHLGIFLLLIHISGEKIQKPKLYRYYNRQGALHYVRYLFNWWKNHEFVTEISETFPNETKIFVIRPGAELKFEKKTKFFSLLFPVISFLMPD